MFIADFLTQASATGERMGKANYPLAKTEILERFNRNNGSVRNSIKLRSVLCVFYNTRAVRGLWEIHGCGCLINGLIIYPIFSHQL